MATDELLTRFGNWISRLVHPHRREINRARELERELRGHAREVDVRKLLGKIAAGVDVTPHLSRDVRFGYASPGVRDVKRTFDLLLNDWGVHHLHLGHAPEPDGFNEHGGELIFIIFRPSRAFVLGVADHRSWTRTEWVARAVRNWPHEELFLRLNGAVGLERPVSEEERLKLRRGHVNAPVEVEGRVFMGGVGGLMSSGVSFAAVRRMDAMLQLLRTYDADHRLLVAEFSNRSDLPAIRLPRVPRFGVVINNEPDRYALSIVEETLGVGLRLGTFD